ncbi:MAG: DUF309 domain-containing protein [Sulfitobacter sp.]
MVDLPPYPYVPGKNVRHPEDWFDEIKSSVTGDLRPEDLDETAAWKAGRAYFDAGFFWECHEVLEAVWMQTPQGTPEREMAQALIQLANARLKLRMDKPRAVLRLCDMVAAHLEKCPQDRPVLGLWASEITAWTVATRSTNG